MENNYQYIDPDFVYTNKNGVLYNLANIEDENVLLAYEILKYLSGNLYSKLT
jgi:hypothetical protein